ncbi:cysteine desulfurase family protein [Marinicrinis lubricantis]|uniref:Cysteine desulfurase family protein n=1 Tax=Marinicrinis lubricantis TaxID=2086470 RepID=A0ABW1IVE8_9BACL
MVVYLDYAATTPPFKQVTEVVTEVMEKYFGNPSSLHRLGMEAERLLERSREVHAGLLQVKADQIVFTSGGTESNNLAVKGTAFKYQNRGKHLVTTQIEHACVYESFRQLQSFGFDVTYVKPDEQGIVHLEDIQRAVRPDTILVSVMHVNNETGAIQPIEAIGKWLKAQHKILFHVDAVQSVGKLPIAINDWGIDLLSMSAHKINGPRGTGILVKKSSMELEPLMSGGGQEMGFRSGTENVAAIVGMAKALRMTLDGREVHTKRMAVQRERIKNAIQQIPELILNGPEEPEHCAPHIINFSFPGMKSEVVLHALEKHGFYVSSRSACSSSDSRPSRVLEAMGLSRARAASGIRISLGANTMDEEISELIQKIEQTVTELKPQMI